MTADPYGLRLPDTRMRAAITIDVQEGLDVDDVTEFIREALDELFHVTSITVVIA